MKPTVESRVGSRLILFDGGLGSELHKLGLPPGVAPEAWNLSNPAAVAMVHHRYALAGAEVVTTNTFGGTRSKLAEFRLHDSVFQINKAGVELCREAVGDRVSVAASIGPTGKLMEPLGPLTFEEAYTVFAEQVKALAAGLPDLFIIETMSDLNEVKAAVLAVIENSSLPFIVTMTFDPNCRTATGTPPESMAITLEPYRPLAIGANCGLGPQAMSAVMQRFAAITHLPLIAQANAGLPRLVGSQTVFEMPPSEYVSYTKASVETGLAFVGGCCGTTPEHIAALREAFHDCRPRSTPRISNLRLASRVASHVIGPEAPFTLIGERINPTGRKQLSREIRDGSLSMIISDGQKQEQAGAQVLDVNISIPGLDEPSFMRKTIMALQNSIAVPLSFDSPDPAALEAACTVYAGRPLLNSVNGEPEKLARILPLAKRYGAALICLTMDQRGLPQSTEERLTIAQRIVDAAIAAGLQPSDLLFDCLTLTAGSQQRQAWETLEAVQRVRSELGVATVLGVSNVSFGLPDRPLMTSAFLAMAIGRGLDAAIVNPHQEKIRELLTALEVLAGRDQNAARYIAFCGSRTETAEPKVQTRTKAPEPEPSTSPTDPLFTAIINGDRAGITQLIPAALKTGVSAESLIQQHLVPAMTEVGTRYEQGIFFLPQLILAGETMQRAFEALKPALSAQEQSRASSGVIVLATVKGDLHDIGKNIVAIILRNHGFTVIDLGKDVPLEVVTEAVIQHRADIVALSALMTTTLPALRQIVQYCAQTFPQVKTMIGGAVVTAQFAEQIGANGYAKDAVAAGKKALELVGR